MAVRVSYCNDLFEQFFLKLEETNKGITRRIRKDFRKYKSTNGDFLPDYFGKDEPYGSPQRIAGIIHHIHLCIPPDKFPPNIPQRDKKCKKFNNAKDIALLYARNLWDLDRYCILAILMPDAHNKAHDNKLMLKIAQMAEKFRDYY